MQTGLSKVRVYFVGVHSWLGEPRLQAVENLGADRSREGSCGGAATIGRSRPNEGFVRRTQRP